MAIDTKGLRRFLTEAFDAGGLRMFIADNYSEVSNSINWNAPLNALVFDVVGAMERRGLIDHQLVDHLIQERPMRHAEIEALRGSSPSPGSSQRHTPPPTFAGSQAPPSASSQAPTSAGPPAPAYASAGPQAGMQAPPASGPWDVFLAHSSRDKPRVRSLHDALHRLSNATLKIFFDEASISPGEIWPEVIKEALRTARCAVIILSKNTNSSWYLQDEIHGLIERARKRQVQLLPVYLDDLDTTDRYGLRAVQGIHAVGLSADAIAERILEAIAKP